MNSKMCILPVNFIYSPKYICFLSKMFTTSADQAFLVSEFTKRLMLTGNSSRESSCASRRILFLMFNGICVLSSAVDGTCRPQLMSMEPWDCCSICGLLRGVCICISVRNPSRYWAITSIPVFLSLC